MLQDSQTRGRQVQSQQTANIITEATSQPRGPQKLNQTCVVYILYFSNVSGHVEDGGVLILQMLKQPTLSDGLARREAISTEHRKAQRSIRDIAVRMGLPYFKIQQTKPCNSEARVWISRIDLRTFQFSESLLLKRNSKITYYFTIMFYIFVFKKCIHCKILLILIQW